MENIKLSCCIYTGTVWWNTVNVFQ